MNSKKALAHGYLVLLIICIVVLIVLLFQYQSFFTDGGYETSLLTCSQLFKSIDGKPGFFDNSLSRPLIPFFDIIGQTCDSKSFKISPEKMNNAASLVRDCWIKGARGEDFWGDQVQGEAICLYCGSITSEESVNDFDKGFSVFIKRERYESLFDESESINLNSVLLSENYLPKNLDSENEITVFYYSRKDYFPKDVNIQSFIYDKIGRPILQNVGKYGGTYGTLANYYASSLVGDSKVSSGIVMSTSQDMDPTKSDLTKVRNTITTQDCIVIVPEKHYN